MANVTQWLVNVTLIRPLNKVEMYWPSSPAFRSAQTRQLVVPRTRTNYGDPRPKLCRPRTSYLEQSTCCAARELQTVSEIFNGECDAMIE